MIAAGIGMAAFGFGARFMLKTIPNVGQKMANAAAGIPKFDKKVSLDQYLLNYQTVLRILHVVN